jgi:hypothetical protein
MIGWWWGAGGLHMRGRPERNEWDVLCLLDAGLCAAKQNSWESGSSIEMIDNEV